MAQNIGYIRVSSVGQNTDRQLDSITLDKVFTEKVSGCTTNNRPVLQECIEYAREGDTLHLHSIDRLARNLADLQAFITRINAKGVMVMFHKEGLTFTGDSNNPMNQLMLQMMGAFAEFERSMIKERQKEGIAKALSKGTKFGAAPKFTSIQIEEIKTKRELGISVAKLADEFDTSRQTIYTILKKSYK